MEKNYDNLEVFIQSCNRAEFIEQTLKSICEQSAGGFEIIVLDNASTDNTKEVVEEIQKLYPKRNISFIGSEKNIGGPENTKRGIEMAKKEWAMIFHDDDIMHPEYIKTAMNLLNQNPDAVMASCTYIPYENPDDKNWETFSNGVYIVDVKGFAALIFGFIMHNFASSIYKTEFLKKYKPDMELYGKISDRPFMMDISKHGKHIILKDPYIRYRIHPGQDTNTFESGPFAPEWFALMNCYKEILSNSWFDKYGLVYNSLIYYNLKLGYYWMKSVCSNMSYFEFKKEALNAKVLRRFEEVKIVEKLYRIFGSVYKKIFLKFLV